MFTILEFEVSSGPFSTICWILRDVFTFGPEGSAVYVLSRLCSSIVFGPISLIDYVSFNKKAWERNACEYAVLARKR